MALNGLRKDDGCHGSFGGQYEKNAIAPRGSTDCTTWLKLLDEIRKTPLHEAQTDAGKLHTEGFEQKKY